MAFVIDRHLHYAFGIAAVIIVIAQRFS